MSWRPTKKLRAILFDLDGTLADTAPDLGYALNSQRLARGLTELGIVELRKQASSGARGLLEIGFGIRPGDAGYIEMRDEFLDIYEQNLSRGSTLFSGIPDLLQLIEEKGLIWGVVTNKAERFTLPLLKALNLLDRSACVICGDTTPNAKPHPAPMLEAMSRTGTDASECLYIGDDERDVQAAHAAGIKAVVVRYGYLGNGTQPENWGAEVIVDSPAELSAILFGR